ncbi:Enolase, C-terminal TIM barrel domain-containing protein [Panaeolus papilionaceus]|nr:Enolase, C-terminal TIM barrel domain-containing protein [Panaeolus papilionaceus]
MAIEKNVSESIAATKLARSNGWAVMISHLSGETDSSFIADLVVGLGVCEIKSGAPAPGERLAKYNALLRVEEELMNADQMLTRAAFRREMHLLLCSITK